MAVFADDKSTLNFRLGTIQVVVAMLFAMLAICFWYVQVLQHAKFEEMAASNHSRTLPRRAPRGMLFDRNGRLLVENRDALNISLVRENRRTLDQNIKLLAEVTEVPEQAIRDILERNRRVPAYRPVVIIQDATLAQVSAVLARKRELSEVIVEQVPTRRYPKDDLAAHLFGYVGEITDAQLVRPEFTGLTPGAVVGQAGIEQTYNNLLMGKDGAREVIVNSLGREIAEREELPSTEGKRLQLTIDYDLQKAAQDGFTATGFNGSAIMLDANSGEILSLVSRPAFDPNDFSGGIDRNTWQQLMTDKLRPLQNRAIQGRYSPGSTFKIAVAVAALEEGIVTPAFRVFCPGGGTFYGRYYKCHQKGGHGSVDMRHALEGSCNVYFYTLGNMLGVDRMHKWASALGLGVMSGIDLPHETLGLMPSTAWKKTTREPKWYPGETISVAIGQGQVSVTPISLAVMMMTVANGGTRYTPHLVRAAYEEGKGWQSVPPPPPQSKVQMKQSTIDAVHEGLWMVVNAAGTGRRGRLEGRDVAGKTGTAQVISLEGKARAGKTDKDLRDHGWFVFFAPANNPQVAGMIFAEHAEHGYLGAPIAKHMINTYFLKKEGKPLPVYPTNPFDAGPGTGTVVAQAPAPGAAPAPAAASAAVRTRTGG
jgi:penicillin-binding protein 2